MCRGTGDRPRKEYRGIGERVGGRRRQRLDRGALRKAPRGGVRHEQRFHFALQLAIVAAGSAEERPALGCGPFQGVLKHLLDAIPPRGRRRSSTSYRAAQAVRQPIRRPDVILPVTKKTCRLGASQRAHGQDA